MGPLPAVVADVDAEDMFEVAAADDQEPAEALAPDATDPALDVRVGVWRPNRTNRPRHSANPRPLQSDDAICSAASSTNTKRPPREIE